jgi:membrane-associated phospholipid phosphatase
MSDRARVGAVVAAVAALIALSALVSVGELTSVDGYAVRNLMPGGLPTGSRIPVIGHLLQYHGHGFDLSQVVRLPANIVPAVVVLLLACWALWRRGQLAGMIVWVAAFGIGNAIAVLGKETITRPALYAVHDGTRVEVPGFATSFPSGHSFRLVLLAAMLAALWPRLRWLLALWAAGATVSLEIDQIHTPSDIAGGLLLAAVIVLALPFARRPAETYLLRTRAARAVPIPLRRRPAVGDPSD